MSINCGCALHDSWRNYMSQHFVLVLNTKKAELAKLKNQVNAFSRGHSTANIGEESYADSRSRSVSPVQSTLNENEPRSTTKRRRNQSNNTNTSEEEDVRQTRPLTRSRSKNMSNTQESSLDLGNDQMDYKTSTIDKHPQRRKYIAGTNSISKRPFATHGRTSSAMTLPSLPDDSQTTDDLLNKI
ncbi:unnamed protein product [Adineta ricciae]|uniref:Uncharacterized protein n=1 Tax=Adineta ricciae TaxID=249248 RepID=A0A813VZL1_ADIRI|nr:unnamed protein product [Adineta ricciae]